MKTIALVLAVLLIGGGNIMGTKAKDPPAPMGTCYVILPGKFWPDTQVIANSDSQGIWHDSLMTQCQCDTLIASLHNTIIEPLWVPE